VNEHPIITKSHEKLQIQLTKNDVPSSSTSSCDHANIIEENTRLKDELAKSTIPIGENNLNDLLSNQRSNNVKTILGYVSKANKKNNKKKRPSPHKQKRIPLWVVMPQGAKPLMLTLREMLTLTMSLFRDYYGDVYAKYIGPHDENVAWSIWVPKTLVANKRGPIKKLEPKTKH
jgi:hypothetical protein